MNIQRVAVLGAGTMGRGIAQVAAQGGFDVTLRDVDPTALSKALAAIEAALSKGVEIGKVAPEAKAAALARIATTTDLAPSVRDADLVIEAVPENLAMKQGVFREVDALAGPHAVLATNTSSLSVTKIASSTKTPSRVVGMHFFNPPHLLRLVEIVRGRETDSKTIEAAVAATRRMNKEPIVVQDVPGFASSRLGVALGLEAIRMLEQGVASAEDIDRAMELGYNHPMGPLRLTDLVGLDVRLAIARHLHQELRSEAFRPPGLLERMVKDGKLGRKSGRGFYEYPGGKG